MIGGEHSPWMERMPRCGGCLLTGAFFFFAAGLRLLPGIWVWSPPGEGQGVRGACPSTPPTPPYSPLSVLRRASLSYHVYPVRRSPQGQVGAHLPASRVICAPAAALPPRPGSLGWRDVSRSAR